MGKYYFPSQFSLLELVEASVSWLNVSFECLNLAQRGKQYNLPPLPSPFLSLSRELRIIKPSQPMVSNQAS